MSNTPEGLPQGSQHSLIEADKERGRFSDEDNAHGAAGVAAELSDLQKEPMILTSSRSCFDKIHIGLSWDRLALEKPSGLKGLVAAIVPQPKANVDLDLGCLYEMEDGTKGCLQAFGNLYGQYDEPPFIRHSGDEQTGKSDGNDEWLDINGAQWSQIKRVLVYAYIYKGAVNWNVLRSECHVATENRKITLSMEETSSNLPICALLTLENEHGQIKLTRRLEYFAGHPEMDRAYGYGMQWEEGAKS